MHMQTIAASRSHFGVRGEALDERLTAPLSLAKEPVARSRGSVRSDRPSPAPANWAAHARHLNELDLVHDDRRRTLWQWMTPTRRPSFTPELIGEITSVLDLTETAWAEKGEGDGPPVSFLVLGSRLPGVFNLGGDLPLFLDLIERGDRETLRKYACACVRGQHRWTNNLHLPLCTIALVQGDALGGAFEVAMAHSVLVAERRARFGLPEVLFNLFPGMGAYSFLARRLDAARAERMILSGRVYTAEEMHEMGIVDVLADDGRGIEAVEEFIDGYERSRRTREAVARVRDIVRPVTLAELLRVTDIWVDTAMDLGAADLRKMRHLAKAQDRMWSKVAGHGRGRQEAQRQAV